MVVKIVTTVVLLSVSIHLAQALQEEDEELPLPRVLPPICVICKCTIKKSHRSHYNIQCSDSSATYELSRDDSWPKTNVRSLSLTHAKLENLVNLPNLTQLSNLHSLSFSHNALQSLPDNAFKNLNLKELNLAYNGLSELKEDSFNSDLQVLKLQHNNFDTLNWTVINTLENLEELYIQDNFIKDFEGAPNLQFLKVLNMSGNEISELPTDMCSGMPALQTLLLSDNDLGNVSSCLLQLHELRTLTLDGNNFKKIQDGAFAGLALLKTLSLSRLVHLVDIDGFALRGLKSLNDLRISHNPQLAKISPTLLIGKDADQHDWKITNVDLSYNAITMIPKDMAPWDMLHSLDLQGNPWDCSCEAQWMLDVLVPILYNKNSSYLEEVRCETPLRYAGVRLVHWLNHTSERGVWCDGDKRPAPLTQVSLIQTGSSHGMLIALSVIAGVVIVLIIVGVVLQRRATAQRKELATRQLRCRNPRNGNVRLTHPSLGI